MANEAKSYFERWLEEKIDNRRERAKMEPASRAPEAGK